MGITPSSGKSLAERCPDVAAEWHPTLNDGLTPWDVSYGSGQHVWWQCAQYHAWQAAINNRTALQRGCPICGRQKAARSKRTPKAGEALAVTHSILAAQWHPTKNGELTPADVKSTTPREVWWLGDCGHSWPAPVRRRVAGGGLSFLSG